MNFDNFMDYAYWIIIFLIVLGGIYFLFKYLNIV